jgi:hypothetical protein
MQAIPSEFLAIDRKTRKYIPFFELDTRDPNVRVCDFLDVIIPLDKERAMLEASRCVHCPDPQLAWLLARCIMISHRQCG